MSKYQSCPLCSSLSELIKEDNYYSCPKCRSVFLDKNLYISNEKEKRRYEEHNNNVYDSRYRKFVSPITSAVFCEQSSVNIGLDFGSGTGPVISTVLKERGYNISQYDLFFYNNKNLLEEKYDYIVCCEVVEHFKNPKKEFNLFSKILKPGGSLYIMTDIYNDSVDFKNWYYRQDPTHIFIYSQETFEYIYKKFKFKSLSILGKLIIFKK